MATSATKKQGEGTRERRKANFHGKAGGAAKKYAATRPAPPHGVAPVKKAAPPPPRAPVAVTPQNDEDFGPLPPPGGHSLQLTAELAEQGKGLPANTPFARMAARAREQFEARQAKEEEIFADAAEAADAIDQDILAGMTRAKGAERRPTRTHKENAALLEEAQKDLPALREDDPFKENVEAEEAAIEADTDTARKEERKRRLPIKREITPYRKEQKLGVALLFGLPNVVCNKCPAAEHCPEHVDNADCFYDEHFRQLPSRDGSNVVPFLQTISDIQAERGLRAVLIERLTAGGALDPNVTRQLQVASDARLKVLEVQAMLLPPPQASSSSTSLTVTTSGAMPPGGGLLSALVSAVTSGRAPTQRVQLPGTDDMTDGKVLDAVQEERVPA